MTNPYEHERRKRRTPKQMAAIFAANNGQCHVCERKFWPGDIWQLDHKIPLECGGSDDDENLAPACSGKTGDCHKDKTAEDHKARAKIQARFEKHNLPSFLKEPKGRPLPGTKRSGLRKKMDGSVEKR